MTSQGFEYIVIEFIWGKSQFRDGYDKIGSFQVDEQNWPHIYITAPKWVIEEKEDLLNDATITLAKEFLEEFNSGTVNEEDGILELYTDLHLNPYPWQQLLGFFSDEPEHAFRDYRLLTSEEFSSFLVARDKLAEFYKDTLWFIPVIKNYQLFFKTMDSILQDYLETGRPDYSGMDTIAINSAFNGWLTSITSYINHTEYQLKQREINSYWKRFHNHQTAQYDNSVSYRFIYGMRNYIQHKAPPIHLFYRGYLRNEEEVSHLGVYCHSEEIQRFNWKPQLQNDITNMESPINIPSHVSNMMECLLNIFRKHCEDEFDYLEKHAQFIQDLISDIPSGSDRGVYEVKFLTKKTLRISAHMMYENVVKAILERDLSQMLEIIEG